MIDAQVIRDRLTAKREIAKPLANIQQFKTQAMAAVRHTQLGAVAQAIAVTGYAPGCMDTLGASERQAVMAMVKTATHKSIL